MNITEFTVRTLLTLNFLPLALTFLLHAIGGTLY